MRWVISGERRGIGIERRAQSSEDEILRSEYLICVNLRDLPSLMLRQTSLQEIKNIMLSSMINTPLKFAIPN